MRALLVSTRAADPARRLVYRVLQRRGLALTLAVPEQWRDANGTVQRCVAGDDGGMRIAPIPVRAPLPPDDRTVWQTGALRRLARDVRPDLVHAEREPWTRGAMAAFAAARGMRVPFTLHVASPLAPPLGAWTRWRTGRLLGAVSGLVGSSTAALTAWRRSIDATARTAVIADQPTIVPPRSPAAPRDGLHLAFVGRLIPERGCDLLLRALVNVHGPWTLSIAGSGPSQEELEALAARLGIAARVRWLGGLPAEALEHAWRDVDVAVLPARSTPTWQEPNGLMLRDAMAREVAVIATRSGALTDVLGPELPLIAEEDPAALAAVLQSWLADPALLAEAKASARSRIVSRFTVDAIADQLHDFLTSTA